MLIVLNSRLICFWLILFFKINFKQKRMYVKVKNKDGSTGSSTDGNDLN